MIRLSVYPIRDYCILENISDSSYFYQNYSVSQLTSLCKQDQKSLSAVSSYFNEAHDKAQYLTDIIKTLALLSHPYWEDKDSCYDDTDKLFKEVIKKLNKSIVHTRFVSEKLKKSYQDTINKYEEAQYRQHEFTEIVSIETTPNAYNERYLRTKKERMGHTLHFNK